MKITDQILIYAIVALGTTILGISAYTLSQKAEIKSLVGDLDQCKIDLNIAEINTATLLDSIDNANKEIEVKVHETTTKNNKAGEIAKQTFDGVTAKKKNPTKDVQELNKWLSDLLQ